MIYAVTEWYDNSNQRYFFDTSKVDRTKPFELAYLALLERAATSKSRWVEVQNDVAMMSAIEERFGSYQDGSVGWKRLTTRPPCQVDVEVTLTMAG
jgi:hypothetical protein